jgi:Holliday junction resolvase RusA-like endonuclease
MDGSLLKLYREGRITRDTALVSCVNYENMVKLAFMNKYAVLKLEGAIKATITAYMPIPKSESKKKKAAMEAGLIRPKTKVDIDNICKAILDALNKIAYDDDGQIVELHAKKLYSENPRAEIILEEIGE